MSYYILNTPNKMNNYGQIFTKPIPGKTFLLPDNLLDIYLKYKGYVILTVNDINEIVKIEPNLNELNDCNNITDKIDQITSFEEEIEALKEDLNNSDYKIIKCMEAFMGQFEMPYDYLSLIDEREAKRHRINELEQELFKKDEYLLLLREFSNNHEEKGSKVTHAPER